MCLHYHKVYYNVSCDFGVRTCMLFLRAKKPRGIMWTRIFKSHNPCNEQLCTTTRILKGTVNMGEQIVSGKALQCCREMREGYKWKTAYKWRNLIIIRWIEEAFSENTFYLYLNERLMWFKPSLNLVLNFSIDP